MTVLRRRTAVTISAWTLVIAGNLLFLELGFALYHYYVKHEILWFRTLSSQVDSAAPLALANPVGPSGLTLSPYFGYVNSSSETGNSVRLSTISKGIGKEQAVPYDCALNTDTVSCRRNQDSHGINWEPKFDPVWKINNYGFAAPYDYPVSRGDSNAFVIGVFGGSVAFHYAFWASDRRSQVLKSLEHALGRPVVVLNFGVGGGKQPQQVLQLAHFVGIGQRFDLVLNIDGFNEIYVSWLNMERDKTDFSMPAARILKTITNGYAETLASKTGASIAELRSQRSYFTSMRDHARLTVPYYFASALSDHFTNQLRIREAKWSRESVSEFPLSIVPASTAFDKAVPDLADMWFRNSVSMNAIARAAGARYLHVLQPNQYFSRKAFSQRELTTVNVLAEGDAPLRRIVPAGYRAFVERSKRFPELGVPFVAPTRIFDRVPDDIYFDWCCHFNEAGTRILDLVIQREILRGLDATRYASQIQTIDNQLIRATGMPVSGVLSPDIDALPDVKRGDAMSLKGATALILKAEDAWKSHDSKAALAGFDGALRIVGALHGRDPKNVEVLHVHLRAYRGQSEVFLRTGDRSREVRGCPDFCV